MQGNHCLQPRGFGGKFGFGIKPASRAITVRQTTFDTGLNQNEWTANYIWDGTTNSNNFAYFRKTFVVTNKPELAKVYVTAHNDYLLYCNGQLLGRGPARCDPYHYGQYNAYDVTKLLKTGTNVFAAMGHWRAYWNNAGIDAQPAFLLEARLDYPDGSSSKIGTDESWKVLAHTAFIETEATNFATATRGIARPFNLIRAWNQQAGRQSDLMIQAGPPPRWWTGLITICSRKWRRWNGNKPNSNRSASPQRMAHGWWILDAASTAGQNSRCVKIIRETKFALNTFK